MVVFFDTSDPLFVPPRFEDCCFGSISIAYRNLCATDGSVANRPKGLSVFLSFSGSEWAGYFFGSPAPIYTRYLEIITGFIRSQYEKSTHARSTEKLVFRLFLDIYNGRESVGPVDFKALLRNGAGATLSRG
jgi:hypothetical protein